MSNEGVNFHKAALAHSLAQIAKGELTTMTAAGLHNGTTEEADEVLTTALATASDGRRLSTLALNIHEDGRSDLTLGYVKAE